MLLEDARRTFARTGRRAATVLTTVETSDAERWLPPWHTPLIGAGTPERTSDAIVHTPTVHRMLRSYGALGEWDIEFHEDAQSLIASGKRQRVLFVDSLQELAYLQTLGRLPSRVYLLGKHDDALAEEAELYGVKALLTCPAHWFEPVKA